jgi:transposase
MYIDVIPNRNSPPAILLREGIREGKKVRKHTLANISSWPPEKIESLRRVLHGETLVSVEEEFEVERTKPHGHVAAVLGTVRRTELDRIIFSRRIRERDLVLAMIVARIIEPSSKLATARGLGEESLFSTLGEVLGVESADENDLYGAMDWLLKRQERIERKLVKRHLSKNTLVLYDVTSTYFEGRTCPLAKLGHPRDGKKGKLQIQFGLLCNQEGCPVAVEVFEGNTGDPKTFTVQVKKMRERFGLERVVYIGDRGMITEARIKEDLKPIEGLDWITALRAPAIRKLVEGGSLQLSLFDEKYLGEISDPDYPDERLIVCRNPFLAKERSRKREDLLQATERELDKIVEATRRQKRRLTGEGNIGLRVGKVLGRYKMKKHFNLTITGDRFSYERDQKRIDAEAALDGIYVIRTSVSADKLDAEETVRAYKDLSVIERAFRSIKTVDLKVRPVNHRKAERVRSHVFLCMLAYYVEWHMRRALKPMLFDDDDKAAAAELRESVVAPAKRSERAKRKAQTKRTETGEPVHSFQTLLKDLQTVAKNRVVFNRVSFDKVTVPTPLQQRAFDLLGVSHRI